jgi:hypothetical protein
MGPSTELEQGVVGARPLRSFEEAYIFFKQGKLPPTARAGIKASPDSWHCSKPSTPPLSLEPPSLSCRSAIDSTSASTEPSFTTPQEQARAHPPVVQSHKRRSEPVTTVPQSHRWPHLRSQQPCVPHCWWSSVVHHSHLLPTLSRWDLTSVSALECFLAGAHTAALLFGRRRVPLGRGHQDAAVRWSLSHMPLHFPLHRCHLAGT